MNFFTTIQLHIAMTVYCNTLEHIIQYSIELYLLPLIQAFVGSYFQLTNLYVYKLEVLNNLGKDS